MAVADRSTGAQELSCALIAFSISCLDSSATSLSLYCSARDSSRRACIISITCCKVKASPPSRGRGGACRVLMPLGEIGWHKYKYRATGSGYSKRVIAYVGRIPKPYVLTRGRAHDPYFANGVRGS
ncbi:hypothetical protein VNO80_25780 [Phaseolus coccineus]|uniref:Uncharacterized protein n=1 Tax=Phaseolus coccineus TaxID=3886 RepID=A0AAN9LVE5_PHACN